MRRRLSLALLAAAAAAAAAIPLIALGGPGSPRYPDLRADPPTSPFIQRYAGSPVRLLIRFDGFVTNVGDGPLDVEGNPSSGRMMQRVSQGGLLVDDHEVPVQYESNDGHNHWHLKEVMRYSLRAAPTPGSPLVAPGQKTGFCLVDSQYAPQPRPTPAAQLYSTTAGFNMGFCGVGRPDLTSLRMGVSVGWRDVYNSGLAFQWVDVSETAPGSYYLASEADPNGIIAETNESNPPAFMTEPVTVPGYRAAAVGPVPAAAGTPTPMTLTATTVGTPGARGFLITAAPSHGTLSLGVGATTSGNQVVYTPDPGFGGTDSFRFAAVTTSGTTAGFPRTPPEATATIAVSAPATGPRVTITGAPASMLAGTAVQLGADVTGAAPGVSWSASAGTITTGGLLTAPATPPAGGAITVRAASTAAPAASAEVAIAVEAPPAPRPAPLTPGSGPVVPARPGGGVAGVPGSSSPRMLSHPRVRRSGRILLARVAVGRGGRLSIAAIRGGRVVAICSRRVRPRQRAACALRLPPRLRGRPVVVAVGLRAGGVRYSSRTLSRR